MREMRTYYVECVILEAERRCVPHMSQVTAKLTPTQLKFTMTGQEIISDISTD